MADSAVEGGGAADVLATPSSSRIPEIDWLKGFAILSVIWIHAKPWEETLFYREVVNRAVMTFLFLFGVSSELWWSRHAAQPARVLLARWYRERAWRLMVPLWTVATLWWLAVFATGSSARGTGWGPVLLTYLGYSPWIGPSWFVTLLLQLVLLFPLLRLVTVRLGLIASLGLAALVSVLCAWHLFDIIAVGRRFLPGNLPDPAWYYAWIFAPRVLWHVTAGIFIARAGARPRPRTIAVAAALVVLSVYLQGVVHPPDDHSVGASLRQNIVSMLADVPMAIVLLGLCRGLHALPRVARLLAFCGAASWGIYLAHVLVHEVIHMQGHWPETNGAQVVRVTYAVVLLGSGIALTVAGAWLRRRAARVLAPEASTRAHVRS